MWLSGDVVRPVCDLRWEAVQVCRVSVCVHRSQLSAPTLQDSQPGETVQVSALWLQQVTHLTRTWHTPGAHLCSHKLCCSSISNNRKLNWMWLINRRVYLCFHGCCLQFGNQWAVRPETPVSGFIIDQYWCVIWLICGKTDTLLKQSVALFLFFSTASRRRVWISMLAAITLVRRSHVNSATTRARTASCCWDMSADTTPPPSKLRSEHALVWRGSAQSFICGLF